MKIYTLNGRGQYPNYMAGNPMTGEGLNAFFQWVVQNAGEIIEWTAKIVPFVADLIGPSYDSRNGGEVRRQLEGLGQATAPWANPYLKYIQDFYPELWQSGNIWDVSRDSFAHPSTFKDAYMALIAAGMPAGVMVDRNMVPVGFAEFQRQKAPPPTATELTALQAIAIARAGLAPDQLATANQLYAQLPNSWRRLVDGMVALLNPSAAPDGAPAPPPNADQLATLQQIAAALAGFAGVQQQQSGQQLVQTLPPSWQQIVSDMVAALLQADPNPPIPPVAPPAPTTTTAGVPWLPIVAVGAAFLLMRK